MLTEALLLMAVAVLAQASTRFLGCLFLERPVVAATLTGLVLGDLRMGLLMAGTLELVWMGVMYIGLSMPSDVATGSIVGTAVAILSGQSPEVALGVSIPTGILSAYIVLGITVLVSFIVQRADKYAQVGDVDSINRIHIFCGVLRCFLIGLMVFFIIYFGEGVLRTAIEVIPESVMSGLNAAAGMLPAIGFAMLLNLMWNKVSLPYFFIGFLCVISLSMEITAIAVAGAAVAAIHYFGGEKSRPATGSPDPPGVMVANYMPSAPDNLLTKKDLNRAVWRTCFYSASTNAQRWQALGFLYAISPALKKLYGDKTPRMAAACRRHVEMINSNEFTAPFIIGATLALEQVNSHDETDATAPLISATKLALMGPVSAMGDTIFWGTLRIIACGIGASLCLQGNPLGPVLFLLIFNVPAQLCRYFMLHAGFKTGVSMLHGLTFESPLARLVESSCVLGLIVIGAMTAAYVTVDISLVFTIGETTLQVQAILDSIFSGLLPLLLTFACAWLMRKKEIRPQYLILAILAIGLLGGLLGIM